MNVWEDQISANNFVDVSFDVLDRASSYKGVDRHPFNWEPKIGHLIPDALERDSYPLPQPKDREGYYGENHFSYWASGLLDYKNITECAQRHKLELRDYLDFGCASGRVIRHFLVNAPETRVYGCDLNRSHIEWVARHLDPRVLVFQNHSIPTLPLPDNSLDFLSAYSVFTHIEAFETTWLMEFRRILRPGGLAWITIHSEHTWDEMGEGWPLYNALKRHPDFPTETPRPPLVDDRKVYRWKSDRSYSSNVFYRMEYLRKVWGRYFEISETHRRFPHFQDVVVLRKT